MTAELWQVELARVVDPGADLAEPVTEQTEAEAALRELGIEFDHVEPEWAEGGLWLVGLVGRFATLANRGEIWHTDHGWIFNLAQP